MLTPQATCRARVIASGLLVLGACATAHAGWSPGEVEVRATTNSIPSIVACSDGAAGAIVAWQEETAPGQGTLRAQHVLASGDLDPAWPTAGSLACAVPTSRMPMGALPDRLGGAYLWWKEGSSLYLTRLQPDGAIASGWPARGRYLGEVNPASPAASVIEDGAHGLYVVWAGTFGTPVLALGVHLGPDGTGAGGWPDGESILAPDDLPVDVYWPQAALAPDGGIFLGWGSWSADTTAVPSRWRVRRLDGAGSNAAGWPVEGISLGAFHRELLGDGTGSALLGIGPDGLGGFFMITGSPDGTDVNGFATLDNRLHRRDGNGQPAPGWPAAGQPLSAYVASVFYADSGPDGSLSVSSDGQGGALVGGPQFYDHGVEYAVRRLSPSGQADNVSVSGNLRGREFIAKGDGGSFLAHFSPNGPSGPFQPPAYLRVDQSLAWPGWTSWGEYHDQPLLSWYGDIALAPSGDGGAILLWSQARERFGLFARRFSLAGQVIAAGLPPTRVDLTRVRFVAGQGVRAMVSLPPGAGARLELFDLTGRRRASLALDPDRSRQELTLGGTTDLASGLYFVRLATREESRVARVVVAH